MPHPIAIAGILAIVAVGLVLLVFRLLSRRPHQLSMLMGHPAIWPTERSAEECHEEHRDYLRERAKNDRH